MLTILLILIIIASILLIVIILAQNPKGGGLTSIGAGASQFLGARQTADFLEKSTWYFGLGILVIVIFSYFLVTPGDGTQKFKTEGVDYAAPMQTNPAPGQPNPLGQPQGQPQPDGGQPQPQPQPAP